MPSVPQSAPQRVALYARVSSEDQAENENIQVQVDFLRRYCDLHGLEIAWEYLDDGLSGTIPLAQRPHGSRLLEDARAGHFGAVLFYRVSRLGRRLAVVLDAYEALDQAGVTLRSGTEPIDTASPVGRFVFQMLGAFAELDRETIIDNTSRGKARGAKNGRWYGVVPLGYTVHDKQLAANDAEILPGIAESDLARGVFERIADGSSGVKEVVRLAALGLRPFVRYVRHDGNERIRPLDGEWNLTRITRMIRNPLYKGTRTFRGRHGEIEQDVPALVSDELWERANRQLTDNRRLSRRNAKYHYLLRGLIRCGLCGSAYQGTFISKGLRRYYHCGRFTLKSSSVGEIAPLRRRCGAKSVPADWLEQEVWNDCEGFLRNPGQLMEEVRRQFAARQEAAETAGGHRKLLVAQLAAKDRERQTIITMARRRILRPDEAEAQLEDIAREQRDIQAELDAITNRQAIAELYKEQARSAQAMLHEIRGHLDSGIDEEMRRDVVRKLVGEIVVHTEGEGRAKRARLRVLYRFTDPMDVEYQTTGPQDMHVDLRRA